MKGHKSAFYKLPTEIIKIILEMACETAHLRLRDPFNDDDVRNTPLDPTIFAATQISSHIRKIAMSTPSVWRSLATAVVDTAHQRRQVATLELLSLLVARCSNTLTDFTILALMKKTCCWSTGLHKMISLMAPSQHSLKVVHLVFPDNWFPTQYLPHLCSLCRPASSRGYPAGYWSGDFEVPVTALLACLSNATSLEELAMNIDSVSSLGNWLPGRTSMKARPRKLQLAFRNRGPSRTEMRPFLHDLASDVAHLSLNVGSINSNPVDLIEAILSSCDAKLQQLDLVVGQLSTQVLSRPTFTKLTRLAVWTDQLITQPSQPLKFPCLVEVEAPLKIFSSTSAPLLKRAVVTMLAKDDDQGLIKKLKEYPELEDLVLHSQDDSDRELKEGSVLREILWGLTPYSDQDYVCPLLRRLSITGQQLDTKRCWLSPTAFEDPKALWRLAGEKLMTNDSRREPAWLGIELWYLVNNRRHFEDYEIELYPNEDGENEDTQIGICQSLTTLAIFGCQLHRDVWEPILAMADWEQAWCYPNPLAGFHRKILADSDEEEEEQSSSDSSEEEEEQSSSDSSEEDNSEEDESDESDETIDGIAEEDVIEVVEDDEEEHGSSEASSETDESSDEEQTVMCEVYQPLEGILEEPMMLVGEFIDDQRRYYL